MEELVIRWGQMEGARNPNSNDVRQALEDVESWKYRREEFTIEKFSNWRPDVIDGRRVIRHLSERPSVTAATFYCEGNSTPLGWFIRFYAEDGSEFSLAASVNAQLEYIEGVSSGGPLTIRTDCLVSLRLACEALTYFVERLERSPNHLWVSLESAIRFPE